MSDTQKNLYKKFLGLKGEKLAQKFLKKAGYKIIKTNYVTPYGEADIIALKDGFIVFIEVKTRTSLKFGMPKEAVGYKKQSKYKDIANYYLIAEKPEIENVSFAVVEVMGDDVNLITDAF